MKSGSSTKRYENSTKGNLKGKCPNISGFSKDYLPPGPDYPNRNVSIFLFKFSKIFAIQCPPLVPISPDGWWMGKIFD
jgi:hypothetical protein